MTGKFMSQIIRVTTERFLSEALNDFLIILIDFVKSSQLGWKVQIISKDFCMNQHSCIILNVNIQFC